MEFYYSAYVGTSDEPVAKDTNLDRLYAKVKHIIMKGHNSVSFRKEIYYSSL